MPIKYYIAAIQVMEGSVPPAAQDVEEALDDSLGVIKGIGTVIEVSVSGPFPQAGGLNSRGQVEVLKFTGHVRRPSG